jgi:enamine deaminase RidA (YjgF/YER057c/UK114 family)
MLRALPLILAAAILAGCASAPPATTECFHANAAVETDIGYCQAVRAGDTLYISGSVGQGDMPAAVQHAYATLRKTLEARGLSFQNVVKETVYTTDLDAFIQQKEIRKQLYGKNLPAATWVQVSRLFQPSFVVEIELTARYPR